MAKRWSRARGSQTSDQQKNLPPADRFASRDAVKLPVFTTKVAITAAGSKDTACRQHYGHKIR